MKEEIRDKHIRILKKLRTVMSEYMEERNVPKDGVFGRNYDWVCKTIVRLLEECDIYQTILTVQDNKKCNELYKKCY